MCTKVGKTKCSPGTPGLRYFTRRHNIRAIKLVPPPYRKLDYIGDNEMMLMITIQQAQYVTGFNKKELPNNTVCLCTTKSHLNCTCNNIWL